MTWHMSSSQTLSILMYDDVCICHTVVLHSTRSAKRVLLHSAFWSAPDSEPGALLSGPSRCAGSGPHGVNSEKRHWSCPCYPYLFSILVIHTVILLFTVCLSLLAHGCFVCTESVHLLVKRLQLWQGPPPMYSNVFSWIHIPSIMPMFMNRSKTKTYAADTIHSHFNPMGAAVTVWQSP